MKPADCLPGDRHRYFHNGWMLRNGTPVRVNVSSAGAFRTMTAGAFRTMTQTTEWSHAPLGVLEPFYPEGGCINTYDMGIVIARSAKQVARRTASVQHYSISWCPPTRRLSLDTRIMWDMCSPPPYPSYEEALHCLEVDGRHSVAISPDIILYPATPSEPDGDLIIMWHSHRVGMLAGGLFVPDYEDSCFTKLTRMALQELNIPCL